MQQQQKKKRKPAGKWFLNMFLSLKDFEKLESAGSPLDVPTWTTNNETPFNHWMNKTNHPGSSSSCLSFIELCCNKLNITEYTYTLSLVFFGVM
jgi:hypothetical protein